MPVASTPKKEIVVVARKEPEVRDAESVPVMLVPRSPKAETAPSPTKVVVKATVQEAPEGLSSDSESDEDASVPALPPRDQPQPKTRSMTTASLTSAAAAAATATTPKRTPLSAQLQLRAHDYASARRGTISEPTGASEEVKKKAMTLHRDRDVKREGIIDPVAISGAGTRREAIVTAAQIGEAQLLEARYLATLKPPSPARSTYQPAAGKQVKAHRDLVASHEKADSDAEKARARAIQTSIKDENEQIAVIMSRQKKELASRTKQAQSEAKAAAKREKRRFGSTEREMVVESLRRRLEAEHEKALAEKRHQLVVDSLAMQIVYLAKRAEASRAHLRALFELEKEQVAAQHEDALKRARENLAFVAKAEDKTFKMQMAEKEKRRKKEKRPMSQTEKEKERTSFLTERDRVQAEQIAKMETERARQLAAVEQEQHNHFEMIDQYFKNLIDKTEAVLGALTINPTPATAASSSSLSAPSSDPAPSSLISSSKT